MKKHLLLMLMAITSVYANAQNYQHSRYYNHATGRLDYSQTNRPHYSNRYHYYLSDDNYFGLRVGPTFATVSSDDSDLNGGNMKTGLNIGVTAGISTSAYTPLYFETGLYYTEKGGKKESFGNKMTYDLEYLKVPLSLKYIYSPDGHFAIQPYIGGYLACGVGGKIKNFGDRESYSSFGEDTHSYPRFSRFDGGLKVGCGISYDMLYAEIDYEYGLTNISNNTFGDTHNSALTLNFGINF